MSGATSSKTCELKVEGMMCGSCEWAVESAMGREKGFVSARVSHGNGKAIVKYDPSQTSPQMLAKAVTERSGYKAATME